VTDALLDSVPLDSVLLDVTRGGVIESRHRGSFVLLDASGGVDVAAGAIDAPVYPRSSLKPLQTVAMVASGFDGPPESLAIASASHSGEPMHLAAARRVLAAAGLDEAALQCPPDLPRERDVMLAWVHGGGEPARICHNCSGKHSAMVATCAAAGWDVGSYLALEHPLQVAIVEHIERLAGCSVAATSVDGCGAPAHALPLVGLARSFAAVASAAPSTIEGRVGGAVRAHPELVGGTGRAVTELMAATPGLVAKDGAEGVWAAALPDGRAFAAKVSDGSGRALPPLLAAALTYWGLGEPAAVARWSSVDTLGGGRPMGSIRWAPELRALLSI
jgi:L-asparaginase II